MADFHLALTAANIRKSHSQCTEWHPSEIVLLLENIAPYRLADPSHGIGHCGMLLLEYVSDCLCVMWGLYCAAGSDVSVWCFCLRPAQ